MLLYNTSRVQAAVDQVIMPHKCLGLTCVLPQVTDAIFRAWWAWHVLLNTI